MENRPRAGEPIRYLIHGRRLRESSGWKLPLQKWTRMVWEIPISPYSRDPEDSSIPPRSARRLLYFLSPPSKLFSLLLQKISWTPRLAVLPVPLSPLAPFSFVSCPSNILYIWVPGAHITWFWHESGQCREPSRRGAVSGTPSSHEPQIIEIELAHLHWTKLLPTLRGSANKRNDIMKLADRAFLPPNSSCFLISGILLIP